MIEGDRKAIKFRTRRRINSGTVNNSDPLGFHDFIRLKWLLRRFLALLFKVCVEKSIYIFAWI